MKIFKSLNKRKLVVLHKKCRVFYTEWLCARFINKSSNGNTDFNPIKDLDLRKKNYRSYKSCFEFVVSFF